MFTPVVQADTASPADTSSFNSQQMPLAASAVGPTILTGTLASSDVSIQGAALAPAVGPLGSTLDVQSLPQNGGQISVYTIHSGDTLGGVAAMFGVTKATITSANDLAPNASLKAGDTLVILPISGYQHIVKSGETLASISQKTGVPASDIAYSNDLDASADLMAGDAIFIPDTDLSTASAPSGSASVSPVAKKDTASSSALAPVKDEDVSDESLTTPITVHPIKDTSKRDIGNALLRPVPLAVSTRTQGAHGWDGSAVDLAAPAGTPIVAAADGTVLLARTGGYNDGYGNYVIIMSQIDGHEVETLYAHMSKVIAVAGETVARGEKIGLVGMTGDATGNHVHFEVRGAQNPIALDPEYTGE